MDGNDPKSSYYIYDDSRKKLKESLLVVEEMLGMLSIQCIHLI
jgi:hypothetical protein